MYLDLADAAGLPRPLCQWPLAAEDRSGRVDFIYVPQRLALELDGRAGRRPRHRRGGARLAERSPS